MSQQATREPVQTSPSPTTSGWEKDSNPLWASIVISSEETEKVLQAALIDKYFAQPDRVKVDPAARLKVSKQPQWHQLVELTEEETARVMDNARMERYLQIEGARKSEEAYSRILASINRPWDADELADFLINTVAHTLRLRHRDASGKRVPGLKIDDDNRNVFKALCCYFTNDAAGFESMGRELFGEFGQAWDIEKGIYLFGPVGTGKTTMMRLFRANKRQSFDTMPCIDIANGFIKHGAAAVQQFFKIQPLPLNDIQWFCQRELGMEFEDLGTEETAGHFGNKKNVMAEIFLARYREWERGAIRLDQTHATGNIDGGQAEEKYGVRVSSRMREMWNVVELLGKDRRQ